MLFPIVKYSLNWCYIDGVKWYVTESCSICLISSHILYLLRSIFIHLFISQTTTKLIANRSTKSSKCVNNNKNKYKLLYSSFSFANYQNHGRCYVIHCIRGAADIFYNGEFSNLKHFFCSSMMRCCYYIILMNVNPTWYCPITSDFLKLIFNHFTFEHRSNTVPTRQNLWERRPNSGFVFCDCSGFDLSLLWQTQNRSKADLGLTQRRPRADMDTTENDQMSLYV